MHVLDLYDLNFDGRDPLLWKVSYTHTHTHKHTYSEVKGEEM